MQTRSISNFNKEWKREIEAITSDCKWLWRILMDRHQNRDNLQAIWFCSFQSRIPSISTPAKYTVGLWRNPDVGVGKHKNFKRSLGSEATSAGAFWILILLPFVTALGRKEDLHLLSWGPLEASSIMGQWEIRRSKCELPTCKIVTLQ